MPSVRANDIELAYDTHGSALNPPLVLIQGLGMPSSAWPPELIEMLVGRDFHVVTFDNRDIGQSQLIDAAVPNLAVQWIKRMLRLKVRAPYRLTDMMQDAERLMDALNLGPAHVVGISMGGMIAQLLAIHHPGRVRSLISIMSTTGRRRLPGPTREVTKQMMSKPASESAEDRMAFGKKIWRLIGSPEYPPTEEELEQTLIRIYERGLTPAGIDRQMLAIMAAKSRVKDLGRVDIPTLVIHGDSDPLVPVAAGIDTHRIMPNARLAVIPGLGHDLPAKLLEPIAELIREHTVIATGQPTSTGLQPVASDRTSK